MVNLAARATNGIKIPGRKATRKEIISTFKKNLTEILFCELSSTILEEELGIYDEDNDPEWVDEEDPSSWDRFSTDIDSDVDN